jgi:hypothetical protein
MKEDLEDVSIDGKTVLNWILKKYDGVCVF